MSLDRLLKLAFLAGFLVAAGAAIVAARRAAARHGAVNYLRDEIRGLIPIRAVLGLVFYAALIIWLFGVPGFAWSYVRLPDGVRQAAGVLLVVTVLWLVWSYRALGSNYRAGVGLHGEHELVTTGPYRFLRHPIYLAFVLLMVLTGLMSQNWVLGLSGLSLVGILAAARVPEEERRLRERFKARWDDYQALTGAFFPR